MARRQLVGTFTNTRKCRRVANSNNAVQVDDKVCSDSSSMVKKDSYEYF